MDEDEADVHLLGRRLVQHAVFMLPVVLAELLSAPELPASAVADLVTLPRLESPPEFWVRAGQMRRRLILRKEKYKPKLADTLIAQNCIDYNIALLTRDSDFMPFAKHEGLRLVKP